MGIPLFLAVHPEESAPKLRHFGRMVCHLTADGITPPPADFPREAMLIVGDATSPRRSDPTAIAIALANVPCAAILLDFQKPDDPLTEEIAAAICKNAQCPVGVSPYYAQKSDCAVFLPPIPPDRPMDAYLQPWQGREIWLDVAPSPTRITITEQGSRYTPLPNLPTPENSHLDEELFCHYRIQAEKDRIQFDLWRTNRDIWKLLQAGEAMGVATGVGLYQELGNLQSF